LAESAGVEPARPFGLVALAPRCLAARPTLQVEPSAGFEPALARGRNPALYPLSYEGMTPTPIGWGGRSRTCSLRSQNPLRRHCATPQCHRAHRCNGAKHAPLHELVAEIVVPLAAVEAARTQAALLESSGRTRTDTGHCARASRSVPCLHARRDGRVAPGPQPGALFRLSYGWILAPEVGLEPTLSG
jgi:hypothetical protein